MASAREVISPDGICLLPLLIGLLQITLFNIDSASSLLPLNFFFFQILHRTNYPLLSLIFVFIQSPSHVWLFMTPWTATCQASLSLTISQSLPKIMSIALVIPSSHFILWHPISFCFQSFLASWTFPMRRLFASGDYNTEVVQVSSVTQSRLTLCDPMNCSMPGLPVDHPTESGWASERNLLWLWSKSSW